MATVEHALSFDERDRARDRTLVRRWLYTVALLIVAMVVVVVPSPRKMPSPPVLKVARKTTSLRFLEKF